MTVGVLPDEPRYFGAPIRRTEDPRFLTGQARYLDDIPAAHALHVAFVRSDLAHARLLSVDTGEASAVPGVAAILTGIDAREAWHPIRSDSTFPGWQSSAYWPLAVDKVRFVGEAVAAVVASDRYVAEDAAELVQVDYEPLPAHASVESALADDAERIHDNWIDNVFLRRHVATNGFEAKMAGCAHRLTLRTEMARHSGMPMETRACLAEWDPKEERLVVHATTQSPFQLRAGMAEVLGIPESQLQIIAPDIGGSFGVKHPMYPEEIVCALLAKRLGQPVKWVEDRREHMLCASHSREHDHDVEVGFDDDGVIHALRGRIVVDCGAYSMWPITATMDAGMALGILPGPYRIRHYKVDAISVATNKTPLGAYRGVSRPAACFTIERTIDSVARHLGLDPAEVRRRNMVRRDEFPYVSVTGMTYDSGSFIESIDLALDKAQYQKLRSEQAMARDEGIYLGIGVVAYTEQTAHTWEEFKKRGIPMTFGFETSSVEIDATGHVTVRISGHSHGQGLETTMAQLAAEVLGVSFDTVHVRHGDTSQLPYGMGTFASRTAVLAGGSIHQAACEVRTKLERIGAHLLEASVEDVTVTGGVVHVVGSEATGISVADVARTVYHTPQHLPGGEQMMLLSTKTYDAAPGTGTFTNAAMLAVVEVDVETGGVAIRKFLVVEDCGRVINPMIVDGQIRGGVAQGIGSGLLEEYRYDEDANPLTTTFVDYLMPGVTEVPPMEIHHLETPSPFTIWGIKGMGEGGAIGPGAVLAAAVEDAISPLSDARVRSLPLTPERVLAWIDEGRARDATGTGMEG
jgi:carbon-monoxide dehydrogenase large subunit